jgi:ferric-dicitrate binding protein FerR (iron transport regulator)
MRSRYVDLTLTSGRILASHGWGEATARFTVATAHGQLTVTSNALVWVESDATRTRITCASGSIGFQPKGASSTTPVSSGFVAESSGTTLNVTPADADPLSQERVVQALDLDQPLRDLAARNRNVLPR